MNCIFMKPEKKIKGSFMNINPQEPIMIRVKYIQQKFEIFNEGMTLAFNEFHDSVNSHQQEIIQHLCKDKDKFAPCDTQKLYDDFISELYSFYYKEVFWLHIVTSLHNDTFNFGSPFQLFEYFLRFDSSYLIERLRYPSPFPKTPFIPFEDYFMQLILCTSCAVKSLIANCEDLKGIENTYYRNKANQELIHWFYYELEEKDK